MEKLWLIISDRERSDAGLRQLLGTAREYADLYVLAKKRQKGCDGMGELAMVREEFSASLDGLMHYCKRKGYIVCDIGYEIDSAADELTGSQ
jgi:hypothetical protein